MKVFLTRATQRLRSVREVGMTMIEIVVALMLLGIVTSFATSTILNTTTTSSNFNQGVQNEANLLDAISLISRDVSLASGFQYASSNSLAMTTTDSGASSQVFYFHWTGNTNSIPTSPVFDTVRVNQGKLPSQNGIVEYRVVNNNTSNPVIRNLIPNYNAGGNSLNSMFTYYDTAAQEVLLDATTPPSVSADNLKTIRRVEMHFTSYIESRDNPMEMHTSAVPRLLGMTTKSESNSTALPNGIAAPVINGNLPQQTNEAKLWWGAVAGADSYTVYYMKDNDTSWKTLTTVQGGSGQISVNQKSLTWGSDYTYKVVAFDHLGSSDDSNTIKMRVTPEPTDFNNKDSLRMAPIANWTVARNLENSLYWDKAAGANTKYRLRTSENGAAYSILWNTVAGQTQIESGKDYGDVTRYTVTAFNDIVIVANPDGTSFQTGGEAAASPYVELVSPPIAPTLSVTPRNDITSGVAGTLPTNTVSVTNASAIKTEKNIVFEAKDTASSTGYTSAKKAANTNAWTDDLRTKASYSSNKGWGTRTFYSAYASNDAGDSPTATTGAADQHPGPFALTDLQNNIGYANFFSQHVEVDSYDTIKEIGEMSGTWSKSLGSSKYDLTRDITNTLGAPAYIPGGNRVDPSTRKTYNVESGVSNISSNVTGFKTEGVSPGVVYTVKVTSKASANSLIRSTSSTLLTRPDVPKSGEVELLCLADGTVGATDQSFAMYVSANTNPKYGTNRATTAIEYWRSKGSTRTNETRNLSSREVIFQELPGGLLDIGTVKLTNVIRTSDVPNSIANFGTDLAGRSSETPYLDAGMESGFGTPCDENYGKRVSELPTKNSKLWVVHQSICYGFIPGRDYGQVWVYENNWRKIGLMTYQKDALVRNGASESEFGRKINVQGGNGCGWRLDPEGAEPYFESY